MIERDRLIADAEKGIPPPRIVAKAIDRANESPCRSKRGAVVFRMDSREQIPIGSGFNHKPVGFECDGSQACKATCRTEAVHAEQSALLRSGLHAQGGELLHVKVVDGQLVPSGGPSCAQCSKLALAAGIVGVWLYHEDGWRRYDSADFHRRSLLTLVREDGPQPLVALEPVVICDRCGRQQIFDGLTLKEAAALARKRGWCEEENDGRPVCSDCWAKYDATLRSRADGPRLREYAQHKPGCKAINGDWCVPIFQDGGIVAGVRALTMEEHEASKVCTCGLDQLLRREDVPRVQPEPEQVAGPDRSETAVIPSPTVGKD